MVDNQLSIVYRLAALSRKKWDPPRRPRSTPAASDTRRACGAPIARLLRAASLPRGAAGRLHGRARRRPRTAGPAACRWPRPAGRRPPWRSARRCTRFIPLPSAAAPRPPGPPIGRQPLPASLPGRPSFRSTDEPRGADARVRPGVEGQPARAELLGQRDVRRIVPGQAEPGEPRGALRDPFRERIAQNPGVQQGAAPPPGTPARDGGGAGRGRKTPRTRTARAPRTSRDRRPGGDGSPPPPPPLPPRGTSAAPRRRR